MMRKVVIVFLALSLGGCITGKKTAKQLNEQLGTLTYEGAISWLGPPDRCAEAGSTRTCTWVYGGGRTIYQPVGTSVVGTTQQPSTMTLRFRNDVLNHWELTGRWR